MLCRVCSSPLKGRQTQLCSYRCKVKGQSNAVYANQKKRGLRRKTALMLAKGGKCMRCGYDRCLRALTFHHRDPASKSFPLDARHCSNRSDAVLAAEAEKCDLLCANCHAEIEEELYNERLKSRPAGQGVMRPDCFASSAPEYRARSSMVRAGDSIGSRPEKSGRRTPVKSANATGGLPPMPTPSQAPPGEGVETGHGGTYRAIHGEGTVQTTNGAGRRRKPKW